MVSRVMLYTLLLSTYAWTTTVTGQPRHSFKLTAGDAAREDRFGWSVATTGGLIVVGSFLDDDAGEDSGSAYVFDPDVEVAKLVAEDGKSRDRFGFSVSASGHRAVVGAPPFSGASFGAAYIFERHRGGGNRWGQVKKLTPTPNAPGTEFGRTAAISGDTVVVGARNDGQVGAAYVFERDAGGVDNWGQVARLTASDAGFNDLFGNSVAISGDRIVVGASQDDDLRVNSGSAYVFEKNAGGPNRWGEVKKLLPRGIVPIGQTVRFGTSIALSGRTALVGAPGDGAGGSAYLFDRDEGETNQWGQVAKLKLPNDPLLIDFGQSVTIRGPIAVVGAPRDANRGAAYVFHRNAGGTNNWGRVAQWVASDGASADRFGSAVALGPRFAVVGSPEDDDAGDRSGSAYLFRSPNPICDLTLDYRSGNLRLEFRIGTPVPVRWDLWMWVFNHTIPLGSTVLPPIDPAIRLDFVIPDFPPVGWIGFLTTFVTREGLTCHDFEVVDTGLPDGTMSAHGVRDDE